MNIEELKALMDSKAAELSKSPEDAALIAAHNEAKLAYEKAKAANPGDSGDEEEDSLDDSKLDERTKKYIEKLRRENGKHRTKANASGSELAALKESLQKFLSGEDDEPVEDKLAQMTQTSEAAVFRMAVLEAAVEHGIGKDDREYFEFLIGKRLGEMEEGEELSDEDIGEIAKLSRRNPRAGSGQSAGRSSVNDSGTGANPQRGGNVTVDQFMAMTVVEKSDLYTKDKATYDALWAEAKNKRRI